MGPAHILCVNMIAILVTMYCVQKLTLSLSKTLALSVDEPQVVSDSMSDNSNSIVKPWFYFAVLHGFCIGRPTRSRMLLS